MYMLFLLNFFVSKANSRTYRNLKSTELNRLLLKAAVLFCFSALKAKALSLRSTSSSGEGEGPSQRAEGALCPGWSSFNCPLHLLKLKVARIVNLEPQAKRGQKKLILH